MDFLTHLRNVIEKHGEDFPVILSLEDYVCSRPGSLETDYDPAVAQASAWTMLPLDQEITRRAGERGLDLRPSYTLTLAFPGLPTDLLALTREIMRERYDAELARRGGPRAGN
jgi:hypothetical protein